ncbi:hypothetical protein BLOT_009876 [Blomia tropicalis]|nr:hypothetical protein BLOT_009876 [Blomia tropicalis]
MEYSSICLHHQQQQHQQHHQPNDVGPCCSMLLTFVPTFWLNPLPLEKKYKQLKVNSTLQKDH